MTYEYKCDGCGESWDLVTTIAKRDDALDQPCPNCRVSGKVRRLLASVPISYEGNISLQRRCGDGWNDLMTRMKERAGRRSTIQTK